MTARQYQHAGRALFAATVEVDACHVMPKNEDGFRLPDDRPARLYFWPDGSVSWSDLPGVAS